MCRTVPVGYHSLPVYRHTLQRIRRHVNLYLRGLPVNAFLNRLSDVSHIIQISTCFFCLFRGLYRLQAGPFHRRFIIRLYPTAFSKRISVRLHIPFR